MKTTTAMKTIRLLALSLLVALASVVTQAAVFNVSNGDVAGLIAAINTANASAGADTINLAAGGTYTLTAVDNINNGESGLPAITSEITINGNGATIQRSSGVGTPSFRVLYVAGPNAGNLILNRVTIRGGNSLNGGGIFCSAGTVTLAESTVSDNYGQSGGGVYNLNGTLAVNRSIISNNTSFYYGGGVFNHGNAPAVMTLTDSIVRDNSTGGYRGGGIVNVAGQATLTNSTVSGNESTGQGAGGIWNWLGGSSLVLINSTVSGNRGNGYSGGILNSGGTLILVNSTVSGNRDVSGSVGVAGGIGNGSGTVTVKNTIVGSNTINANNDPKDYAGVITSLGHNIVGDTSVVLTGPGDLNNTNPLLGPLADAGDGEDFDAGLRQVIRHQFVERIRPAAATAMRFAPKCLNAATVASACESATTPCWRAVSSSNANARARPNCDEIGKPATVMLLAPLLTSSSTHGQ